MPWENIGECGCADLRERDRMLAEVALGVQYVRLICGEPPAGCRVGVMWHEHDSDAYATVGLFWDPFKTTDAPGNYISRAEEVLSRFHDSVHWSPLSNADEHQEEGSSEDEDATEGDDDDAGTATRFQ